MVKETRLYDLLEVSTEANQQEIRKAYKALALKYHPDKQNSLNNINNERERSTEIFKTITEAYNILSDSNKRYLYDNYGEEVAKNPEDQTNFSTNNHQYDHSMVNNYHNHLHNQHIRQAQESFNSIHSHFSNPSDTFNQFFNDFTSSSFMNNFNIPFSSNNFNRNNNNNNTEYYEESMQNNNKMRKGRDIMDNVPCTLLDYYNGKDIKLSLTKRVKCPKCKARGGLKIYTCNDCCGTGIIINETRLGMLYQRTESTCSRCNGTGEFIPVKYICDECGGNKLVDTKVIFDFKAPRGVSDGYRIVLPNAADEGINLIPGDVILTLRDSKLDNNIKFKRFNSNLLTTVKIPLFKVLCGGYIKFQHINGETIRISVSRGDINSSNQLKILKGYGMPINKQSSKSSTKAKKNKNKNKKDRKSSSHDNINDSIYNPDSNIISSASDVSSGDEKTKLDFGDLIIKFEIELPDVKLLSNKQVETLGEVLGPNFGKNNNLINKNKNFTNHININEPNNVSASSSEDFSSDDLGSLKMTPQFQSSASSLGKTNKFNQNLTSSDADISISKTEMEDNNSIKNNIIEGPPHLNEIERSSSSSIGSSKENSNDNDTDTSNEKIVYLHDLTNIDKMELSIYDFPEAYNQNNENSTNNGETSVSADATARTAEIMDNSYSGVKPRSKKAKLETQCQAE